MESETLIAEETFGYKVTTVSLVLNYKLRNFYKIVLNFLQFLDFIILDIFPSLL